MSGGRLLQPTADCQTAVELQLGRALLIEERLELSRLVNGRARKLRLAVDSYISRLTLGELENEALTLAARFTIGESYFFRDLPQLDLCRESILARGTAQRGATVRVLSAGCSTGEEIYSLAMLMSDVAPTAPVDFHAIDLNADALERAQRGRYTNWSLRETPASYRDRWFEWSNGEFVLSPTIRQRVTFHRASLTAPASPLPRHSYDVILCRNVLMYFADHQYRTAARRLEEALAPGGRLFLGHAESMRGSGLPLELVHARDSFCYQKVTPPPLGSAEASSEVTPARALPPAPSATPELGGSSPAGPGSALEARRLHVEDDYSAYSEVTRLLRSEQFAEALHALGRVERESSGPFTALCKSLLLVYTNRFDAAAQLANDLVTLEEVSPGAHFVLASCHEFDGELAQAHGHARRSTYLDPTLAMGWLHLGLLSKRLGDNASARRELLQARALLAHEPSDRLAWFGGGCSRTTLIEACARELAATGALP